MASALPDRTRPRQEEEPGLEPPDSFVPPEPTIRLEDGLLRSLLESADFADPGSPLPARSGGILNLATPEAIREAFVETWETLSHSLGLGIDAGRALEEVRSFVLYDIPDGTRSTLTVPAHSDVEMDAGLYCLGLVHVLASLGASTSIVLTHTTYNRERGPDDTRRFLQVLARGVEPFQGYSRRHGISMRLHGVRPGYELESILRNAFPHPDRTVFEAHFLLDYEEEWFLTPEGRAALDALPDVDVVMRHTKLQVSGGWIPIRMRKAAYVYSQNGTLMSNWSFDELASMVAVAVLAKLLHRGEALAKRYVSIDEIKSRYQEREVKLGQRVIRVRPKPKKLFVLGSPGGLLQVYA